MLFRVAVKCKCPVFWDPDDELAHFCDIESTIYRSMHRPIIGIRDETSPVTKSAYFGICLPRILDIKSNVSLIYDGCRMLMGLMKLSIY